MRNAKYYFPGAAVILAAVLIIAKPEILVAIVAASIIMVGIGILYVGHAIRKAESRIQRAGRKTVDGDFLWVYRRTWPF